MPNHPETPESFDFETAYIQFKGNNIKTVIGKRVGNEFLCFNVFDDSEVIAVWYKRKPHVYDRGNSNAFAIKKVTL